MPAPALWAAGACATMPLCHRNWLPNNRITAITSTAMITVLSLRPISRLACSPRASGASAGAVRRMPSGVNSYTHANTTAIGKPIAIRITTSRTAQSGILKKGKTWVAIWTISQPAMAYATATRQTWRRFNSSRKPGFSDATVFPGFPAGHTPASTSTSVVDRGGGFRARERSHPCFSSPFACEEGGFASPSERRENEGMAFRCTFPRHCSLAPRALRSALRSEG